MGNRSRSAVDTSKFSYIQSDQKLQQAAASATRAPVTRIKDGSGWKHVIEEVLDETEDQVLIKWAGLTQVTIRGNPQMQYHHYALQYSKTNYYMHLGYPSKIVTDNAPRYTDSKVLM